MRISKGIYTIVGLALMMLAGEGCSTKRNTWLSRHYQQMTSHFNVYYNAREAYTSGVDKTRKAYVNDYSHVLPVYAHNSKQAAQAGRSDMEVCLKKCHKLVQLHSITVKPESKAGMTDADKRFRAKEEFNPYVPEGYLLMGKANVIMHETEEAMKYFDYLAMKHPTERPTYEAKIWKAILCTSEGRYGEALAALKSYDMDGIAPTKLYADYQAAYANVYITQEEYEKAIPHMEKAVKETRDRYCKRRYTYILAQLYRATGKKEKAAPLMMKLSRQLQDWDMAFAARLDLATVATTPEELAKAEKALRKMAEDDKYQEQQDQIYYSIGHIEQSKGHEGAAIAAFNKSVELSVSNDNQKGLSYLALSDIYLAKPKYIEGAMSIDSASQYLDAENIRKKEVDEKSMKLRPVAKELITIRDNDSLMMLAKMPAKEREKILKKIVDEDKKRREAEEAAKEALEDEGGMSQTDYYQIANGQTSGGKSGWYFYNTSLVNAGKSAFKQKWGRRKNEDNWRRSDKSQNLFTEEAAQQGGAAGQTGTGTEEVVDEMAKQEESGPLTVEKLAARIPLTAEAQAKTEKETGDALIESARQFYDNINDYDACVGQLEEYLRRYPQGSREYEALTMLHFAQKKQGDANGQRTTDSKIVQKYPDSDMAKNISNPRYVEQLNEQNAQRERYFRETYAAYTRHDFREAERRASERINSGDAEERNIAQYLLLRAMSAAKQGKATEFRADLERITKEYAGTAQDSLSQILLAALGEGKTPVVQTAYDSPLDKARRVEDTAVEIADVKAEYRYEPDSAHVVVCVVDGGKLKEGQFRIADYNFTNHILKDYDLDMKLIPGDRQIVVVRTFENKKEAMTYVYALREQAMWKELTSEPLPLIYTMSEQNYRLMTLTGMDEAFETFIGSHYK